MWWNHIKFGIAVVLLTIVIPLLYCLALVTKEFPPTYEEVKNSFTGAKEDIYFK
jgi:hypothetical protein